MQGVIDENLSDIVRDYKLETRRDENGLTVHLHNDPDTPPSAPQRRERWKKVRTIGLGGQSEVVLETCVDGGRNFTERAVKKIRLRSDDSKRRYERELGAIVKFSHDRYSKYFVKSLGWFASSSKLYVVMEYFPAGDLHAYVCEHQGLPEEDCRQITAQLLSAIAVMHTEGFAHRDIKPQNILIHSHPQDDAQRLWWVKLGDFGISKRIGVNTNNSTVSVGTMNYMAPELLGSHASNVATTDYQVADIWALGITVFFILTKAVPFQTPASTLKFAKNLGEPFPCASLDHCEVTKEGQGFIREALRPEPSTRLDFAVAMHHVWIQALFSSAPVPGAQSRSSTMSSRRSSWVDDDDVAGLTTAISTLSSQPASRGQCNEGPHTVHPPKQQIFSQGCYETMVGNESAANGQTETHNRTAVNDRSEMPSNIERLHKAVSLGHLEDVKMLLDQGVSPATLHTGESALHASARGGNAELTRLLCDRGANIEEKDKDGSTALMKAASHGNDTTIELLLEKGADIEGRDKLGETALMKAASYGNDTTIELLLEKGADIEGRDKLGERALIKASLRGKDTTVELLLEKGADIEGRDERGRTALIKAASRGNDTAIELLLEKGADIEGRDRTGLTALMEAAYFGHRLAVELLLEKGADIEGRDNKGVTALMEAVTVSSGNESTIKLLLDKGADIEARDERGRTALTLASQHKREDAIDLFYEYGAEL